MAYGRQRAEWDKAAAMIVHFRRALGDEKITFEQVHPHHAGAVRAENRTKFKALSKAAQEQQQRNQERGK